MTMTNTSRQTGSVIVAGARTPIGRLLGGLKDLSATDLGGLAIKAALARARISGGQVGYVIMGQVIQAGTGQITARQAAVKGGIPMSVPALTINKVCLSGLNAITLADQLIRVGEHQIVVAGGMESMTNAPHLLPKSRSGWKYGDVPLLDSMAYDALFDQFTRQAMGLLADERNRLSDRLTREEQDAFSAQSHQRAAAAIKNGVFEEEIVPVTVRTYKGETEVTVDEGVRPDTTIESLAALRPAFSADGTITAGSSSQISDGAAAVVVMSKAKANVLGLPWLAEIGASGQVAGPDSTLQSQPANAIKVAAANEGVSVADIDLFELNEAFAAVAIQSGRELGVGHDRINVNGGAIALGHPVGMSGIRIALTLAHELRRRGGGTGAAALCGGGGQGDALIIRVKAPASLQGSRDPCWVPSHWVGPQRLRLIG
jgi:acetyl-CoA C-acetyltransferase